LRERKGGRLRGGRLPRRGRRLGGEAKGTRACGDLRPRPLPARERPDDDPAAGSWRLGARADRPGRGGRALRRRAEAGPGLHRAARRPVGQAAGRSRRRAEEGRRRAARVRLAGGRAGGRALLGGGGGSAPLPPNCDGGRLRPAPSPRRPVPHLGGGVLTRAGLGPQRARRALGKVGLMDAWLSDAREALAAAAGVPPEELELSDDDASTLLDLARIAAHAGERTNAPLLCYLVGLARRGGADLDPLADAVRRSS